MMSISIQGNKGVYCFHFILSYTQISKGSLFILLLNADNVQEATKATNPNNRGVHR